MKVALPGATGKLGRIVAQQLVTDGHHVIGIDVRGWPDAPKGVEIHQMDIRKRGAEEIFRKHRPDAAIHMATVTHLKEKSLDRYRINLGGTRAVIDACAAHGVGQVIFVGRHTYYGAGPDSPLYHTEDEPPIGATSFPELADLVAADLYAGQALWRQPEMQTAVLRVCYTLGPSRHGTLASFLERPRVPMVLGFDPLFQFMHEEDVARAICLALDKKLRGVFNVAGPPPLPLSNIIKAAGRAPLPLPEPIVRFALGRFGLPSLTTGALMHIKYPVVVDAGRFREATGFAPRFSEMETIAAFRSAAGY
jgi:UDP-glucose 4-epimerase